MESEMLLLEKIVRPLLSWYEENARILPWRKDQEPYHVWVSEIMLQQTRVEAVKPYYARFLSALPDLKSLADVSEERLLKLWEGLGYYSRVRNMQKAARNIMTEHGGNFPKTLDEIRKLPGIGDYTAGAIASISFGISEPAVDGNVLRVIMRVLNRRDDILLPATKKTVRDELRKVMESAAVYTPGAFNQSLMELGALLCVPNGEPHCTECPLRNLCLARKNGSVSLLPVRKKKAGRRIEERTVLLLLDGEKAAIRRRPNTGLLAGLYEFPSVLGYPSEKELIREVQKLGYSPIRFIRLPDAKHVFSHVEWHMRGYAVRIEEDTARIEEDTARTEEDAAMADGEIIWANQAALKSRYAMPSAFSAYLHVLGFMIC